MEPELLSPTGIQTNDETRDRVLLSQRLTTISLLAQAMPDLEILHFGGQPCRAPSGATFEEFTVLALCCFESSNLRINFQANGTAEATSRTEPPSLPVPIPGVPQTNRVLMVLQVEGIPISEQETLAVGLTLLQIFPEMVKLFKRIGGHIHHTSETPYYPSDDP